MRIGWEDVRLSLQPVTRDAINKMLNSDDPPQRVKAQFLLDQLGRGEELITSYAAPIQVAALLQVTHCCPPVSDDDRRSSHRTSFLARKPPKREQIFPGAPGVGSK